MPNLDLDALARKAETLIEKKQQSRMTIKEMRDYTGLNNVHYAPGFATYGLRGLTKQFNSSAQSIYISDIDYSEKTQQAILNKLRDGIPLSTRDELVNLIATDKIDYHLGDLVITPNGNVYIIASTTSLKDSITYKEKNQEGQDSDKKYTLILNFLFKIASKSFNQYKLENIKSLTIGDKNEAHKGALTINSNSSSSKNPHIRLISTSNTTKANAIKFNELKIYYLDNKWVFESDDTLEFKANSITINEAENQSEIISKINALEKTVNILDPSSLGVSIGDGKITLNTNAKAKIFQITKPDESKDGAYSEICIDVKLSGANDTTIEGTDFILYLKEGPILRINSPKKADPGNSGTQNGTNA